MQFEVTVSYDPESQTYGAICAALHLITESETLEGLKTRAYAVIPDLLELNAIALDVKSIVLNFKMSKETIAA